MSASSDAARIARKFKALRAAVAREMQAAVRDNAADLVRVARVLVPAGGDVHGDGRERDKINFAMVGQTSALLDFGPKSKVIEGNRGPRPFVNPAIEATRNRRAARFRSASRKAVKQVMGNG